MRSRLVFLLCAVWAASAAQASCLAPYWQETVARERYASSVTTADFNGDLRPDIAAIGPSSVFVALNDGGGRFAAFIDVYSGTTVGKIISADLNGDGRADLAFARPGALVVLQGNGDGTFAAPAESSIDIQPTALVAARLDSDNAIDLAAIDSTAAKLVLYRNSGSAHFTVSQTATLDAAASSLAVADFDNDAKQDVVVAYRDRPALDFFYGRGTGTAEPRVITNAGLAASSIVAADLDGDHLIDVAIESNNGKVGVIRNRGKRSFAAAVAYPVLAAGDVSEIAAAELTGDGKLDVLTAARCGPRTSTGAGDGTLGLQWGFDDEECSSYGYGDYVSMHLAAADFDGDGLIDLVTAFPATPAFARIAVFRNRCGDGVVTAYASSQTVSLGQPVTITVDVRPSTPQEFWLSATGNITLRDGDALRGSVALGPPPLPWTAKFTLSNLTPGDHAFIADYAGDEQYSPAQSAPLLVHVVAPRRRRSAAK